MKKYIKPEVYVTEVNVPNLLAASGQAISLDGDHIKVSKYQFETGDADYAAVKRQESIWD